MIWMQENEGIEEVEQVRETTVRSYILLLQLRGKYAVTANPAADSINHPAKRTDYLPKSPMRRVRLLPDKRKAREYLSDEDVKALIFTYFPDIHGEWIYSLLNLSWDKDTIKWNRVILHHLQWLRTHTTARIRR